MANVHGMRDFNAQPNGGNRGNPENYQNLNGAVVDDIPFMNTMKGDQRPPMQETIPYTLKIICCPDFKLLSITFFLLLTIWAMYIVMLVQDIDTSTHEVLQVSVDVLKQCGAAQGGLIKEGEVYRLVTASFLHVNLLHIFMNSISLLIFVSRFEKIYPKQTAVILLVSSVTGTCEVM